MVRYVLPLFGLFLVWAGRPERQARFESVLGGFAVLLGLWGALMGLHVYAMTG
jgi:hypothetical protein